MKGQTILGWEETENRRDSRGRLHSLDGPAVKWSDGLGAYFIEGVLFDYYTWNGLIKGVVMANEAVKMSNVEQRRIAIKMIGLDRFLSQLEAEALEIWHGYALYEVQLYDDIELIDARRSKKQIAIFGRYEKNFIAARLLSMIDPSTNQRYILRVPPEMQSCLQAVSWTFDVPLGQYLPEAEA
jgi:hypothetical protein